MGLEVLLHKFYRGGGWGWGQAWRRDVRSLERPQVLFQLVPTQPSAEQGTRRLQAAEWENSSSADQCAALC